MVDRKAVVSFGRYPGVRIVQPQDCLESEADTTKRRCNSTVHIPHLMIYTRVGVSNEFSSMATIQKIQAKVNVQDMDQISFSGYPKK